MSYLDMVLSGGGTRVAHTLCWGLWVDEGTRPCYCCLRPGLYQCFMKSRNCTRRETKAVARVLLQSHRWRFICGYFYVQMTQNIRNYCFFLFCSPSDILKNW
jgi:hypothetical protein